MVTEKEDILDRARHADQVKNVGRFMYKEIVKMDGARVRAELSKLNIDASKYNLDLGQMKRLLGTLAVPSTLPPPFFHTTQVDNSPFAWGYTEGDTTELGDVCIYSKEVPYKTGTGNVLSFLVQMFTLDRKDVPMATEWEQLSSCGHCKGSSGSCPGFAPRFTSIKCDISKFTVLAVTIDMAWALTYGKPVPYVHSWKNWLTWADRLSSTYVIRIIKKAFDGEYYFSLGSCQGKCHPCAVINGLPCRKPGHPYSMEGSGIDCDRLHYKLYGEYLPWSYKGEKHIQSYMTRYAGVLADESIVEAVDKAIKEEKSYTDAHLPIPEIDMTWRTIPQGVHEGNKQLFYYCPSYEEYHKEDK